MWQSLRKVYLDSRKPADSIFNIFVARPLATPLVIFFEKIRATPNQVTVLGLGSMIAAALSWLSVIWTNSAAIPDHYHLWGGLFLVELAYLFDCADGQLARRTQQTSLLGAEFDFLVDEVKAYLLIGSLSVYWWATNDKATIALLWGIGGLLALAVALSTTRFIRSANVQADGTMGQHAHGDSAVARSRRGPFWWLLMPARLITQYPQSLPFVVFFGAVDLFVILYTGLHAIYALGRLGQLSVRMVRS